MRQWVQCLSVILDLLFSVAQLIIVKDNTMEIMFGLLAPYHKENLIQYILQITESHTLLGREEA